MVAETVPDEQYSYNVVEGGVGASCSQLGTVILAELVLQPAAFLALK